MSVSSSRKGGAVEERQGPRLLQGARTLGLAILDAALAIAARKSGVALLS